MADRSTREERELSEGEGLVEQWAGLLLAPAAFFVHLQVAYAMVSWACVHRGDVWLHVANATSVLLATVGAVVARRVWNRTGREPGDGDESRPLSRARFLAIVGLASSSVFVLLLLAQWAAQLVISPCQ
jgi:hypothetical protein